MLNTLTDASNHLNYQAKIDNHYQDQKIQLTFWSLCILRSRNHCFEESSLQEVSTLS
jgi:hypothetical protein